MSVAIEAPGYACPELLVSSAWLEERLGDPSLTIIDANVIMEPKPEGGYLIASGADRSAEAHIPGAIHLDLLEALSDTSGPLKFMMPSEAQFADVIGAAGISNDSDLILYSAGPNFWATRLFLMFRAFGHGRVRVLDGGWSKWQAEGRPVESRARSLPPQTFNAKLQPGQIIGKDDVFAALNDPDVVMINALSPDAHSGEAANAAYGRPGHIAGSVNVFALDLLDSSDMTFLPADQLQAKLGAVGAVEAGRVITYCGGGISATTDSFALMLIGHDNVALYDGSMTEWGPDESLPMETGA